MASRTQLMTGKHLWNAIGQHQDDKFKSDDRVSPNVASADVRCGIS